MSTLKLRIAIVTTHPPGQGSLNEYGYHFVRYLTQKPEVGEVIVLTDELPAGQRYDFPAVGEGRAAVSVLPCWRYGKLRNPLSIRDAVRRVKPDVVLFNIQFASFGGGKVPAALGLLAPRLTRADGFPTVVLLHNILEAVDLKSAGFGAGPLGRRILGAAGSIVTRQILHADWVALTIPKYVEILRTKYGADNVLLAPHGSFEEVDPAGFDPPPGPPQILTFGKFGTYKRVEILVEAFRRLCDDADEPLELVIAGTDNPHAAGYLADVRRRYADVPGLRFTGYVPEDDVPGVFRAASVVVFPYTGTTGSSGVLHQAGTYGRAVVLPRIGDFLEIIEEEGYAGEIFEPGDTASLAAAIRRVLTDPERRRRLAAQNYLAAHGLPVADVIDWYLIHFQDLLRQRAGR